MIHELKTWSGPFRAAESGLKPWEFRRDDRGFQESDIVRLLEWEPTEQVYTGASLEGRIVYLLRGPEFGIPEGFVIFTVEQAAAVLDFTKVRSAG